MKSQARAGLTLIELLMAMSVLMLLMTSLSFVLLNPIKQTLSRLQNTAQEIRYTEGLRQMQNDLFYAHQVKIVGGRVQGILNDGKSFSYEETPQGLKRVLGQSSAYFTLPEDRAKNLAFQWAAPGLLQISGQNLKILQKVN
jgi:type II secretory pathway pseudopilin PulG